ncbi:hypothetical protein [Hymenobacter sediminicola]|uniref:Uncharacterized protein n=1 Tax=Hymenobacter sediminicola TaxID=2761579 RepID=A0A7G7W835_9BACT|nr:hypothetical protein [Hymenobacter sediminicola]QNH62528.1 hypothetical protein H4317_01480 [Hymenobacter sediminicola]
MLFGLLASCRSEKMAFQFRPAQPILNIVRAETTATRIASASYYTVPSGSLIQPVPTIASAKRIIRNSQPQYRHAVQTIHLSEQQGRKSGNTSVSEKPTAAEHQLLICRQPVDGANDVLFFSGAALVLAGLIIGISIGGSSGLLLALLLFGIGYLLASKAYGSHP